MTAGRARGPGRAQRALVAATSLALVGLAASVPERFPAVDGDLRVRGAGGRLVAEATWATAVPVPDRRRGCAVVVLVLLPDGRAPARVTGAPDPIDIGWSAAAQRVYEQYRDVLPPELTRQLERRPLALHVPAADRGAVRLSWDHDAAAAAAAGRIRLLLAPVCDGAVHGLVELGRPR